MAGERKKRKKHSKKFSKEQKKFIIEEFLKGNSATSVKRAFRLKFGQSRWLSEKKETAFQSVFDTFKKGGEKSVGIQVDEKSKGRKPNKEKMEIVKTHFEENRHSSVREASRRTEIPKSTVHEIAKKQLGLKAYKVNGHVFCVFCK